MDNQLRFDGKVVIVTGAGGGLGREYAIEFARRGAFVVVNDLGGDIKGGGKNSESANKVVDEIVKSGGKAIANYDSVEDGEKIVQTALDNYGRVDIVINNAGILRDRSFLRTSDLDWDLIHRVHLRGAFKVTRAAWPHMRDNKFGRIIMTTSDAGIYGNRGQANYSAAKLGLLGFSNTLAIEGEKYNIFCNTIAPTSGSRLTKTVMPQDLIDLLKPEYVSPLVIYLCHESSSENGGLFELGGGFVAKLRWQRSQGSVVRKAKQKMTPEQVRDCWNEITDFETNPDYPTEIQRDAVGTILSKISEIDTETDSTSETENLSLESAIGSTSTIPSVEISSKDAILYALGIGVSTNSPNHLRFLYELSDDFSILPTYSVIPVFPLMETVMQSKAINIDYTQLLHGEQYTEIFKPLERNVKYDVRGEIVDIIDKGKGAVFIIDAKLTDSSGQLVALNQFSTFVRGAGNFGGKRNSPLAKPIGEIPSRSPDEIYEEKTSIDQAALYRLSGDYNPLHLDPDFSAMGGFAKPILHGLCSYGFSARAILLKFCNNEVGKFKAMKVRFSKPVYPGQSLRTEMWQDSAINDGVRRIFFQTRVVETNEICLSNGYADVYTNNRLAKL